MWNNARFINFVANLLTVLALSALAVGGLVWLMQRPVFTIAQVEVHPAEGEALDRVTPTVVRNALIGRLEGNFFTADLESVRHFMEDAPWVSQAAVRRVWPNGLQVTLREHQPLGLWNDDQVLDVNGRAFTANQAEAESPDGDPLPILGGPEGSGKLVRQRLLELSEWVAPLGRSPVRLTLSPRHAWVAELDNGMILDMGRDLANDPVLGGNAAEGRRAVPVQARVQRFVQALPAIEQHLGRPVMYADLRYPNGFALRLGPPLEPPKKKTSSTTKP
ncbi:FtsQ-type POTRA domain-containing protein [Verticiella sediminum]|uniref:Cell division protein FtsQ n=1 Tax=Verticiella sediminum TaxID=1247510 RepID=A0A556A8C2_9BURK|nr:cell division protein FtsQ/DivIB [Verticiella sediminum]TSH89131.1 FtsQ-type POTRA domain-containing protein [Verticiella sediminum]